jgi:hypothetical protein
MNYIDKQKYPDAQLNTSGNQVILEPSSSVHREYDFPPLVRLDLNDLEQHHEP